jgi:hypothetical protein
LALHIFSLRLFENGYQPKMVRSAHPTSSSARASSLRLRRLKPAATFKTIMDGDVK